MFSDIPFIQEMLNEEKLKTRREDLLQFLSGRFGEIPQDLQVQLQSISDLERFNSLNRMAGTCPDLEAFRLELANR
jgi:hypothetical protein